MTPRRTLGSVASIAANNIVSAAVGLLMIPYLIRLLGTETYGIWTLVTVVVGYYSLLDLGVATAAGRLIAAQRHSGDTKAIERYLSTTVSFYLISSAFCLILSSSSLLWPTLLFNIPGESLETTRTSMFIAGIGISVYLIFLPFTSLLWAYERFDISAPLEAVTQICRFACVIVFVNPQNALVSLALITLGGHMFQGVSSFLFCRTLLPRFKVDLSAVTPRGIADLVTFSLTFFAVSASRSMLFLISMTIVGRFTTPSEVAHFSVARQLIRYSIDFVTAIVQPAATRAVVYHSGGLQEKQRQLFSFGAFFAASCSFLMMGGFVQFGSAFLQLWQGGRLNETSELLTILALGEVMPISQLVTMSILLGTGQQFRLVVINILEAIGVLLSAILVIDTYGLVGVCIAISINATLFRGLLVCAIGLRQVALPLPDYVWRILFPITLISALVASGFALLLPLSFIATWPSFFFEVALYSASYAILIGVSYRLRIIRP